MGVLVLCSLSLRVVRGNGVVLIVCECSSSGVHFCGSRFMVLRSVDCRYAGCDLFVFVSV